MKAKTFLCLTILGLPFAVYAGSPNSKPEAIKNPDGVEAEPEQKSVRPLLVVDTGMDHSSAGTLYSLVPKLGVESSHAALIVGIPFSATRFSTSALGDVYTEGSVYGDAGPVGLEAGLTGGFQTGNQALGLSVGKMTYDAAGSVGLQAGIARFSVDGGYTNATMDNTFYYQIYNANQPSNGRGHRFSGYRRPYVSDGRAAHYGGGLELKVLPRLTVGAGGFALAPFGQQTVYSRVLTKKKTSTTPPPPPPAPPASNGSANSAKNRKPPIFNTVPTAVVAPSEVRDHGASAFASFALSPAVSMTLGVSRSIPFQLTTLQFGMSFDVVRLISRSGRM